MEKTNDLRDLLKHEIEDLQSVEDQILEALPKMIDKANNPDLKKALQEHLRITETHKSRLEKIMQNFQSGKEENKKKGIFKIFGGGKQECKGMKGIIEEGEKIMSSDISPEALDAAIIASAQKVEHYEICGYGTARTFARELGMEQMAKQLEQTLNEEYEADDILTNLAVLGVNEEAEKSGGTLAASSQARSSGRAKEKANREMEMETVTSDRTRSAGRGETSKNKTSSTEGSRRGGQQKPTGNPGGDNGRSSSSKRNAVNERSKTSGRGGRSNTAGKSSASKGNSRGRS